MRTNNFIDYDNNNIIEPKPKNFRHLQKNNLYTNDNINDIEKSNYFNKNLNDNNNNFYNNKYDNSFNNVNKRKKITRTRSIDIPRNEENNSINLNDNGNCNGLGNYLDKNNNNMPSNYIENNNKRNWKNKNLENDLMNEKKMEEIGKTLIKLQKQRNIYLDEYDKLPEHPKKQKDLNDKRELKKLIDDLNMDINEFKRQERNLKKNYFEYI